MKQCVLSLWVMLLMLSLLSQAEETDVKARELADAVFKASRGENWAKVSSIRFTFYVGQGGEVIVWAAHDWNVRDGTDTITWSGKTVKVNVWNPATDADAKAAYARWVNDSYWLLMPLKLRDPGVTLASRGLRELDGKKCEVLNLSFHRVGLTPGDQYDIYIDPATHLVRHWDFMPSPDKKISGTWDGYRDFGGLKLSTEHTFGDKRIWFSDVAVESN